MKKFIKISPALYATWRLKDGDVLGLAGCDPFKIRTSESSGSSSRMITYKGTPLAGFVIDGYRGMTVGSVLDSLRMAKQIPPRIRKFDVYEYVPKGRSIPVLYANPRTKNSRDHSEHFVDDVRNWVSTRKGRALSFSKPRQGGMLSNIPMLLP
jgi:hypothetical protein